MNNDKYTSAISKDSFQPVVCYSIGCDKPATTSIRLPLNAIVYCIIRVCDDCIPKYQVVTDDVDDNDKIHHQHLMSKMNGNGSGAAK